MIFKYVSRLKGISKKFDWSTAKENQGAGLLDFKLGGSSEKKHWIKFKEEEW